MNLPIQNPWWRNPKEIENDDKVQEAFKNDPKMIPPFTITHNSLFLGPRQVGKTTLFKLWIYELIQKHIPHQNILYFSCEPLRDKTELIEMLQEFDMLSREIPGQKYVFLDEITFVKDWELAIKYFLESSLSKGKLFLASGSNALLLKSGSERLPGRDLSIQMVLPLTYHDYLLQFASEDLKHKITQLELSPEDLIDLRQIQLKVSGILPFIDEINAKLLVFLRTGGYLKSIYEFLATSSIRPETYEIYIKWILGDLSKLDRREDIFRSIIKGVLNKYSSKYSLLAFSKEMAIPSHATTSDYLNLLENLLILTNLYQVDLNNGVPLFRKERKCYITDPFLYSVCQGFTYGKYQDFSVNTVDKILEGVVCNSLTRVQKSTGSMGNFLWFYCGKKETDFVINIKNTMIGIELKWQNNVQRHDFANSATFRNKILLSKYSFQMFEDMSIIPVGIFLALLKDEYKRE